MERIEIALSNIMLDLQNPRHEPMSAEIEVVEWFTTGNASVGRKLLNLAKDIAQFGLNPAEQIMVIPQSDKPGRYVVIEGNRRIAALKLLVNPDIAPNDQWKKRFTKLASEASWSGSSVECAVFDSREDADHFVEVKHLGEANGAGVVSWDAIQKSRHQQRNRGRGRYNDALALLTYVSKSEHFDDDARQVVQNQGFPISTLQRMVGDKDFRAFLGIERTQDGKIALLVQPEELAKPIAKVVKDLDSGRIKVGDVMNKSARKQYMDEFTSDERADRTSVPQPSQVIGPPDSDEPNTPTTPPKNDQQDAKRGRPNADNRNTMVPRGQDLPINGKLHPRIRRVFDELRRLKIRNKSGQPEFCNGAVIMFRSLLEFSLHEFFAQKDMNSPDLAGWSNVNLKERINKARERLEAERPKDKSKLKALKKIVGGTDRAGNPNTLNDWVHNHHSLVYPYDAIQVWDSYYPFLQILWETIE